MIKEGLCKKISKETGLPTRDVKKYVDALIDTVIETLRNDEKVRIIGFGNFETKNRPARKALNPRTGEEISVEAKKIPAFKAGKALKNCIK